jgi:PAS domain S-box-containing protein
MYNQGEAVSGSEPETGKSNPHSPEPDINVFFHMAPDLLCVASADGYFKKLNPAWESVTGFSLNELLARPLIEFIHPEDVAQMKQEFDNRIHNKETKFIINRHRCKDESYKWLEWQMRPNEDRSELFAIARDVTARKIAEQALLEAEEKYRLLAVNTSDVIWTINLEGTITYMSPAVKRLLGYSSEEVIQRGIEGIFTPDSTKMAMTTLSESIKTLQSGEILPTQTLILEHLCKGGATIWAEMTVNPMFSGNHDILGFVGVSRDITEQRQVAEQLRQSEKIFRSLAEYSPNMIMILKENRIYYANEVCEKKLGYTKEVLYSPEFNIQDLASLEHKELLIEKIVQLKSGKELEPFEFLMQCKEGRKLYTMVSTNNIQIGKENAILGVILDISEQRWAEETLKRKAIQFDNFSKLMVDRELKMVELKKEVNHLLEKMGDKPKYNLYPGSE